MKKLFLLLLIFALAVPLASAFAQSDSDTSDFALPSDYNAVVSGQQADQQIQQSETQTQQRVDAANAATQAVENNTPAGSNPAASPTTQSATPPAAGAAGCTSSGNDGFVTLSGIPGFLQAEQSCNLALFFQTVYNLCIGVAAIIAVLQISRAGVMYMTSGGNTSSMSEAKRLIWTALMGLVLVLSPVLIFSLINPSINNFSFLTTDANSLTIKPSSNTALPPGAGGANSGSGNTTADSSNSANPTEGSNAPSTSSTANPPTNVQATSASATSAEISWTAPSGGTPPSSYQISENGQLIATASGGVTTATISGLTTGSTHTYTVSSVDGQGNVSPSSNPTTVVISATEISSSTDGSQGFWAYWSWTYLPAQNTTSGQSGACWRYALQTYPTPYEGHDKNYIQTVCQKDMQSEQSDDAAGSQLSNCTFYPPGPPPAQPPMPASPAAPLC